MQGKSTENKFSYVTLNHADSFQKVLPSLQQAEFSCIVLWTTYESVLFPVAERLF